MFYKLMSNDIVIDILPEIYYMRYLPKSNRWVGTDKQSAHGVLGSDQNTIYYLQGTVSACEENYKYVSIQTISKEEYDRYANEIALKNKEKEELVIRINALEETLAEQNTLLKAILDKLN